MSRKEDASLMKSLAAAAASKVAARPDQMTATKYDYQVCINIAPPDHMTSDRFSRLGLDYRLYKWRKKYLPTTQREAVEVRLDPREGHIELTPEAPLRMLTSRSRLYIIGHCAQGEEYLYPNELDPRQASELAQHFLKKEMKVTYQEIAKLVARNLDRGRIAPISGSKLKISILACSAGAWTDSEGASQLINNSFAARLSHCLETVYNIPADVVGRLVDLADDKIDARHPPRMIFSESIPFKKDVTIVLHPQRREPTFHTEYFNKVKLFKVIYTFEGGRQVMKFAYPGAHDWIDQAYDLINAGYLKEKDDYACSLYRHAIHTLATYMDKKSLIPYFEEILLDDAKQKYAVYYDTMGEVYRMLKK